MPTPIEITGSIKSFDTLGLFDGAFGVLKLQGLSQGISTWLSTIYKVSSVSDGVGGVGACVGVMNLNLGGAVGVMEGSLSTVGQMTGPLVFGYASAMGLGLASLPYRIAGPSGGVGTGAFSVLGGIGEPSSLYAELGLGLTAVGYGGVISSLELQGLSQGIVTLFTLGITGGGTVQGSGSPTSLTAPNPPMFVV